MILRKRILTGGRSQGSSGLRKGIETQPFSQDYTKVELVIKQHCGIRT
jgi:hypothetical protein